MPSSQQPRVGKGHKTGGQWQHKPVADIVDGTGDGLKLSDAAAADHMVRVESLLHDVVDRLDQQLEFAPDPSRREVGHFGGETDHAVRVESLLHDVVDRLDQQLGFAPDPSRREVGHFGGETDHAVRVESLLHDVVDRLGSAIGLFAPDPSRREHLPGSDRRTV